jgi:hypothetical protein
MSDFARANARNCLTKSMDGGAVDARFTITGAIMAKSLQSSTKATP